MDSEKDKDCRNGQMEQNIKGIGLIIYQMEKGNLYIRMETIMMVNG